MAARLPIRRGNPRGNYDSIRANPPTFVNVRNGRSFSTAPRLKKEEKKVV